MHHEAAEEQHTKTLQATFGTENAEDLGRQLSAANLKKAVVQ